MSADINHIARRMSVNAEICTLIDLERQIGEVMRPNPKYAGWMTLVADRFGDLSRAVYLADDLQPALLHLAAVCHAWGEQIEEERAR